MAAISESHNMWHIRKNVAHALLTLSTKTHTFNKYRTIMPIFLFLAALVICNLCLGIFTWGIKLSFTSHFLLLRVGKNKLMQRPAERDMDQSVTLTGVNGSLLIPLVIFFPGYTKKSSMKC